MEQLHGLVECSNDEYHSGPGTSKSCLDWIAPEMERTPLHYWNRYVNLDREPDEPTPAKIFGSACHIAVLEPDLLSQNVVRGLDLERRSTADKFQWAQFEQEHEGKIILKGDDYDKMLRVRDAIHRHPVIGPLLRGGKAEQSFYTIDKETGELIKCRTDFMADSGAYIVDLKSTESASEHNFGRSIAQYRYDVQPPWYEDILTDLYGERPNHWMFVVFEKEPPYACGLYFATQQMRELGRAKARRDLRRIAQCRAENFWPDFAIEAKPAPMPGWYTRAA